jgi:23S rRNA pseudouridine2605 synthase
MCPGPIPNRALPSRHGVARVISKLGMASRTEAARWVVEGRVSVNGRRIVDPEFPVRQGVDRIEIEGRQQASAERLVIMLNKPRGLLTTTSDERGRETVYRCLEGAGLPWLAPVGRLDKASEGLLLFSNDPQWAASLATPGIGPDKTYHVQVDCVPDPGMLAAVGQGATVDGTRLAAKSVRMLRHGEKNAWLEVVLDEGKNRQIRKLLQAFDISVLRLIRVRIGPLQLGDLAKGGWRKLSEEEIASLG